MLRTAETRNVSTWAWADSRRARTRSPAPIAGATSDVAAIDRPMPIDVEKNKIELA